MEAAIGMEIREHKSSFAVYVVLRVLVIAVAVLEFFNGNYEAVFLCILTLLLLLAPAFVQVRFRIELRPRLRSSYWCSCSRLRSWARSARSMRSSRSGTRCCTR